MAGPFQYETKCVYDRIQRRYAVRYHGNELPALCFLFLIYID